MNLRELIQDNNRKYDIILKNDDYMEWLNKILNFGDSFVSYGIANTLKLNKKNVTSSDVLCANELIYFYEIVENYFLNNNIKPLKGRNGEIYLFSYHSNSFSLQFLKDDYGVIVNKFYTKNRKNLPFYETIKEYYEKSDKDIKKLKLIIK